MKSYKVEAYMENLDSIIDFVIDNLAYFIKMDSKIENQMRLVCEEAFVNIINYAYPDGEGEIEVVYEEDITANKFSITAIDSGVEFDPLKKEDPDITLPMEDRQIGGLGIFMVKQIMSNVTYERENGKNILCMEKILSIN